MTMMMMMIDVLRLLLCTLCAKWAERPHKVNQAKSKMKQPSDIPVPRFEVRW